MAPVPAALRVGQVAASDALTEHATVERMSAPPGPSDADLSARLELVMVAAQEAGEIILSHFRRGAAPEFKEDGSPVTIADRECERYLRDAITRAFPGDGILGEEFPEQQGGSGYRWILDPIDGTKSFIAGVPLFGVLVGIEHRGRVVVGAVKLPALGETLWAAAGQGAWHTAPGMPQPVRASVSKTTRLSESLFCTTSAPGFVRRGRWDAYERLIAAAKTSRGWGDCYGWLLVATGRAEAMVDTHTKPWDLAPFAVILQEAGGTLTDWTGDPTIHGGDGVGTNGAVLAEVLATLRGSS